MLDTSLRIVQYLRFCGNYIQYVLQFLESIHRSTYLSEFSFLNIYRIYNLWLRLNLWEFFPAIPLTYWVLHITLSNGLSLLPFISGWYISPTYEIYLDFLFYQDPFLVRISFGFPFGCNYNSIERIICQYYLSFFFKYFYIILFRLKLSEFLDFHILYRQLISFAI